MRDWQRLWAIGAACAMPPFLYAVRWWLGAVWPHRRTAWFAVLLGAASVVAIGLGLGLAEGWRLSPAADSLSVPLIVSALLWVWPFVPFGFWPGLLLVTLIAVALIAIAPARRWFHLLMLFLVVTGWCALAGAALMMYEGAFAC